MKAYMGRRGVYGILEGIPEGKRQLGKSSSKLEDTIRIITLLLLLIITCCKCKSNFLYVNK